MSAVSFLWFRSPCAVCSFMLSGLAAMFRRSSIIEVTFVSVIGPDLELISASFRASSAARETSAWLRPAAMAAKRLHEVP